MISSLCALALKSNDKAVGNLCNTMPLLYHEQSCQADHCFGFQGSQASETVDGFFLHQPMEHLLALPKLVTMEEVSGQYQFDFSVSSDYTSFNLIVLLLLL